MMRKISNPWSDRLNKRMRFLLYNIRYAAGIGRRFHLPLPYSGYLKHTNGNFEKIVEETRRLLVDSKVYKKMSQAHNPYGDGNASKRITVRNGGDRPRKLVPGLYD